MPYQIFDEEDGLVFQFKGDVTYVELNIANRKGWEHDGWDHHRYHIWDFSDVATLSVDKLKAKFVAAMDNVHTRETRPMKIALISGNKRIIEILQEYQAYIAGVETKKLQVQIFADEPAARKWVGV